MSRQCVASQCLCMFVGVCTACTVSNVERDRGNTKEREGGRNRDGRGKRERKREGERERSSSL